MTPQPDYQAQFHKLLAALCFLTITLIAVNIIRENVIGWEYVADEGIQGSDFWNDRLSVNAPPERPVIPLQLPGPLDAGWAGPGPKMINIKFPSSTRDLILEITTLDRHESAPPRWQIRVNDQLIHELQLPPGAGVGPFHWKDEGVPHRDKVKIDYSHFLFSGSNQISIVATSGSWAALQGIRLRMAYPRAVLMATAVTWLFCLVLFMRAFHLRVPRPGKTFAFAGMALLIGGAGAFAIGEIIVRAVFYEDIDYVKRFAQPLDPSKADISLFVQGDSVTYGLGVDNGQFVYANLLKEKLERAGHTVSMEVVAIPNRELDFHREALYERFARKPWPRIILYQWFVNDVELEYCHTHICGRPEYLRAFWRRWGVHPWLAKYSKFYSFLDNRFAAYVPDFNRTYTDYLLNDFIKWTVKGQRYRLELHRWATVAGAMAERAIIMPYPMLPFQGDYPLRAHIGLLRSFTLPSAFEQLAFFTGKETGGDLFDCSTGFCALLRGAREGENVAGVLMRSPDFPLEKGGYTVTVRARGQAPARNRVVSFTLLRGTTVLAQRTVTGASLDKNEWSEIAIPFLIKDDVALDVRLEAYYAGKGEVEIESFKIPITYKTHLLDLAPFLKDRKTSVNLLDFHPNPETHAYIANLLERYLLPGYPAR